jgi:outer membrane protein TolC
MVRIKGAEYGMEAAQKQLEITVMNTMSEVIKAYWDLVGSIENLKVQREALRNAERLLKINETRREIGTAADIEVLQAKAGVATRQSELIAARAQISNAEDRLKLLMDLQNDVYFSTAQIVPLDRPHVEEKLEIEPSEFDNRREESIALALEKRPEIRLAELEIANAGLDIIQRRNDTLPQMDLFVTYGVGGRAPNLSGSLQGTRDRKQDVFSYGFQASLPIGNRTAESAYVRSQLSKKQSELRLHQAKQQLMFNVHVAVRNVITNKILMESNRQATRLQEVNVVAEEKRLRLGTSTSFEVLRIQSDLTAAQTQMVQSQIAYEKALIDLELAEGTLLESRGIVYDSPTLGGELDFSDHYISPRWKD